MNDVLWSPSAGRIEHSQMYEFMRDLSAKNYQQLHKWSVDESEQFWLKVMDHFKVIREGSDAPVCTDHGFDHYGWFSKVKLNFAENLLRHGYGDHADHIALNALHESLPKRRLSYRDVVKQTGQLADVLKQFGFKQGDVLGAWMPNIPETVIGMLACTSLGGVFTSTSGSYLFLMLLLML